MTCALANAGPHRYRGFFVISCGLILAIMMLVAGAQAQTSLTGAAESKIRTACRGDYTRFCMGVMPGRGRIEACLTAKAASLSPACKTALAEARQRQSRVSKEPRR